VPRGNHRARGGGRQWPVIAGVVIVLALIGAGAWFFFLREGAPISLGGEREVPEFSFDLGTIRGFPVAEPADKEQIEAIADDIRKRLDAMYVAGFIDPSKWEGGEFPEVWEAFSEQAQRRARKDVEDLTVGEAASQALTFVKPLTGHLTVRFLVDDGPSPIAAVARAQFSADGDAEGGVNVAIQHNATYYMEPVDGDWLIVGYDVHGIVTPVPDAPSPGGGTP
jgi:hypothetical protein